jgi:hypothetical protein
MRTEKGYCSSKARSTSLLYIDKEVPIIGIGTGGRRRGGEEEEGDSQG